MKKIILPAILSVLLLNPAFASAEEPFFARLSDHYENVKIQRVIKADLVELDSKKKIRLIGLKAFEPPKRKYDLERDEYGFVIEDTSDPTTPIEDLAYDFAIELMEGKTVRVEFDTEAADPSGAVWGYVFLEDGTMANAEILRQGFAELQIRPPNQRYADQLRDAYREARAEKRGIQASQ